MDATTLIAGGTLIVALISALVALKRLPGQERSESVNTHHTILADMKLLNDTLVAECGRLRAREAELVAQLGMSTGREELLNRELAECRARRQMLEGEVQRRGLEGL